MERYLHFVSHTHWDREWYESFDAFRFRLVRLMNNLLEILHRDYLYQTFMLDGQTVILEDYLEIHPEREEELKTFIASGRILIGPWYILPDEFLVSGETHIRNLLFGQQVAQRFGQKMAVGYLPDSFGHIAQMPQILKKSGIRYAVIWRGVPASVKTSEFWWEAPDGSRVLTLYMPFGYGTAANLPSDKDALLSRVTRVLEQLLPFATTSHILLMNGSDHVEPDPDLTTKLKLLQEAMPEYRFLHSNLPYLLACIERELRDDVPVYRGEWRANDNAYLLEGTLSTRVYLKKKHASLSHILEGCVEPLWTILSLQGSSYPKKIIDSLWKLLLHNSPHDSICGCSIDAVHEEMMVRYRKMEDILGKLYREAEEAICNILRADSGDNVVIFNPHPWPVTAYLEYDLHLNASKEREVDFEASKLQEYEVPEKNFYSSLVLKDAEEEIVPEILSKEWVTLIKITPSTLPVVLRSQRYRIGFVANLPPCGFKVYRVTPAGGGKENLAKNEERFLLTNAFYEVRVSDRGEIEIREKATNTLLPLRLAIEDSADAGDEYNYSPCPENDTRRSDTPILSWKRRDCFVQSILLKYDMKVPVSLRSDRRGRSKEEVLLPVEIELRLVEGVRWIELGVHLRNNARDHRVRLLFETPMRDCDCFVDGHFAVMMRNLENTDCPQNDFVLLQDDTKMLAILNQGLREYAVTRTRDGRKILAITLLRAVGWLSRNDLLTRKGDAGWPIPTEGSQCLGEHSFRLGIVVSGKRFPEFPIVKEARLFNRPPMIFQVSEGRGHLASGWSFLECDNPCLVISALKQREGRDEVVLRLYNPTPLPQRFTISFGLPLVMLKELSLLEEEECICPLPSSSFLEDELQPFEIKTWGLVFGKG